MCGRYTQTASLKTLQERFRFRTTLRELKSRYNITPTQDCPVVVNEGGRALELSHWGLIPFWAKDPAIGHKMINARAETLLEKPSFKKPFQKSRCLVIADGFYEWQRASGTSAKTPMRIVLKSREPFAMAGLWDAWRNPEGTIVKSFTIVTTAANDTMKPIHDRMPVILPLKDEETWLDPRSKPEKLVGLLKPYPAALEPYEVSKAVNSPRNDMAACIEEIKSKESQT